MNYRVKLTIIFLLLLNCINLSQGYIAAIGGEAENYNNWSDAPYRWIVQKADSGKVIVLSVNQEDNWIPNYFKSFGAVSAINLRIDSRSLADMQSTYDALITAKAIFIKGGDQWNYINYWKGTKTEQAILYVFNNGGVIGGTSAGEMILGDMDFSAQNGSTYPKECLLNPFSSKIALEDNFLDLIPNVLFDSHFIERGRFGRIIPFLVNSHFNYSKDIIGVGVDGRTAICIDKNRIGKVMGAGAVSIFYSDEKTKWNKSGNSYTVENLKCDQLVDGWEFDFNNKAISFFPSSAKDVDTSRVWEYPKTDLWLTGNKFPQNNVNQSLPQFLNSADTSEIVIVTHPGYLSTITPIVNYLNNNNFTFSQVLITNEGLQNAANALTIQNAKSYIIIGDSLQVLSKLSDTSTPVGLSFHNNITTNKPQIYLPGNSGKTAGSFYIDNLDTYSSAAYYGVMTNNLGIQLFGDLIFQPMLWDNSDYYENRVSALFWGLMLNRKRLGVFLDNSDYVIISSDSKNLRGFGNSPMVIVDARGTTKVDSSKYKPSSGNKTRQSVAMNNLRITVSNLNKNYSLMSGGIVTSSSESKVEKEGEAFFLSNNYPNPFNPSTIIRYHLPVDSKVLLELYSITGAKIATLIDSEMKAGYYNYNLSIRQITDYPLSSGVYLYQLRAGNYIETKKMMILK